MLRLLRGKRKSSRACRRPEAAAPRCPRSKRSASPKVLEPVGRQFGVPDRVLDVLVPEVLLQGPRIVAIVGELEPTGMAGWIGNGSLAASPRRWTSRWKPMGLMDPPRSETNTWASLG